MVKCLEIKGGQLVLSEEALMVKEFRALWERDKAKALKELEYVVLRHSFDPSNPFRQYAEDIKPEKVALNVFEKPYTPDALVRAAEARYVEFRDEQPAMRLLIAAKGALEKVVTYLQDLDLTELDDKGKPVHSITQVTGALQRTPALAKALKELEDQVLTESYEKAKTVGKRSINHFEK